MSILNNSLLLGADAGAAGHQISRSLRFNSADSAYLSRTPASAGNRKTWTWSGWVKRSALGGTQVFFGSWTDSSNTMGLMFNTSNQLFWDSYSSGSLQGSQTTSAVFRDTSAWYHIVWAVDTTNATAANRSRIYVNGTEVAYAGATNPSQNADLIVNRAASHTIGNTSASAGNYFSGYLADIHFIDGQALTPSSFAETNATTGQWVPKAYTGSYGTNGFRLDFSNLFDLGNDAAGANDWTPNNLSGVSGGPTSVAAASGALPIYNTTDTYGATKGSGTRTDANSSSIVLAIPMDGANNGTTFTDESATIKGSGSAKTVSRFGDTKTSTAESKFYGSSGYLDGTGDYLTVPAGTDFAYGTGDFCVEAWIYPTAVNAYRTIFAQSVSGTNYFVFRVYEGTLQFVATLSGGGTAITHSAALVANKWAHVAVTRQSNTVRLYVNGVLGGSGTNSIDLTNTTYVPTIGSYSHTQADLFIGYIQDLRVYKGTAKYTANFNPPSATQNPTIAAGNDSLVDTPTSYGTDTGAGGEVRGNYATLNPLNKQANAVLANGNLDWSRTNTASMIAQSTIAMSAGKWYCEFTATASNQNMFGLQRITGTVNTSFLGGNADSWGYFAANGNKYNNNTNTAYGSTYGAGDVIGIAFDADNGTLTFYKNGISQGQAYSGLTNGPYTFAIGNGAEGTTASANFGQRPFAYTAPSGFKALCDTNLPAPTIAKPSTVMDVKLWTGNSGTQTITGLGFSPDLIWAKVRNATASNQLFDVIRGVNKALYSDSTSAEFTDTDAVTAFNSDGWTMGAEGGLNFNGNSYAAWTWDAGSSTVTNTQGSITSQVRANASAGFSIVSWTGNGTAGATVGHGLGAKTFLRIIKRRDAVSTFGWMTFHESAPSSYFTLNSTNAATPASEAAPTSSVFSLPADANSNASGGTYVAYCFAPVAGYSAFGSYTGNGSADGPFVYTGFRPRWLMIKCSSIGDSFQHWVIFDTSRNAGNLTNLRLIANASTEEQTFGVLDILSNGFKIRYTDAYFNQSGSAWIYAAFAESPFQYARAR